MSLVAKVEQLVAETGDGLLNAVKHLAEHLEHIGAGGVDVSKLEAEIKATFEAKTERLFASLEEKVNTGMAALASGVQDMLARIAALEHAAAAAPPAAQQQPAAQPAEQSTGAAQSGGNPT